MNKTCDKIYVATFTRKIHKSPLVYRRSWICIKRRHWIWMCPPSEIKILVIAENFSIKYFGMICVTRSLKLWTHQGLSPLGNVTNLKLNESPKTFIDFILFCLGGNALGWPRRQIPSSWYQSIHQRITYVLKNRHNGFFFKIWQPFTEFIERIPLSTLDSLQPLNCLHCWLIPTSRYSSWDKLVTRASQNTYTWLCF